MRSLEDNLFIKRLENGVSTKLMLMSHNAYWSTFTILERRHQNFCACIFGSGTGYARRRKSDIPTDADFILLDGSEFYRDDEYSETVSMARKMSEESNKRVTVGYVYIIPIEDRTDPSVSCEVMLASIKNGNVDEEKIPVSLPYHCDLLTLADMVVRKHDSLEKQVVLQKQ